MQANKMTITNDTPKSFDDMDGVEMGVGDLPRIIRTFKRKNQSSSPNVRVGGGSHPIESFPKTFPLAEFLTQICTLTFSLCPYVMICL